MFNVEDLFNEENRKQLKNNDLEKKYRELIAASELFRDTESANKEVSF